jgi:Uma2 family endonuclease
VRKRADYAAIGVPEYWLVDPERRALTRFVLRGGDYAEAEAPSGDEVFRPDGFDGLEIPLARLWS